MQLRVTRIKRHGRVDEYAQLVESYRRESDGLPTHRVVASLGRLSDTEIHNLRTALAASRAGRRVRSAPPSRAAALQPPTILDNLRYLDLAVLLELWRSWQLPELLQEVLPSHDASIPAADVVAALTLQRCVAASSKLYATQWLPTSALPELLHLAPAAYNNTRLHRVLDDLDAAGPALMDKLPRRYHGRDGAFVSLFLDVTDTWFVGHGPELASLGKTKEGLLQSKIGIVLLCNERGYPLRWEVISGACGDAPAMSAMLRAIAGRSWLGETPLVCDRSMGHTAQIRQMAQMQLRFLTALTVNEFDSYAQSLPHQAFAALQPQGPQEAQRLRDVAAAQACADRAGLVRVEDDLYMLDLGLIACPDDGVPVGVTSPSAPAEAMRLCRALDEAIRGGQSTSCGAAGRALGLRKGLAQKYYRLRHLVEDIQLQILEGQANHGTLVDLLKLARQSDPEAQRRAFRRLLERPVRPAVAPPPLAVTPLAEPVAPLKVRAVVYFNPERFVEQRRRAQAHREQIATFVEKLNETLANPRCRRKPSSILGAVDARLRRDDVVDVYDITIESVTVDERVHHVVHVTFDQEEWQRRRRYDGFTVLVGHALLPHPPAALCQRYRAKDAVEKDFQTIKSLVELRPIRHRTDGKVRAHVTLCMLALLLERTLRDRLAGLHSAPRALQLLETCHLNRLDLQGQVIYALTETKPEQAAILRALGLQRLGDSAEATDGIMTR